MFFFCFFLPFSVNISSNIIFYKTLDGLESVILWVFLRTSWMKLMLRISICWQPWPPLLLIGHRSKTPLFRGMKTITDAAKLRSLTFFGIKRYTNALIYSMLSLIPYRSNTAIFTVFWDVFWEKSTKKFSIWLKMLDDSLKNLSTQ